MNQKSQPEGEMYLVFLTTLALSRGGSGGGLHFLVQ
jgi:hypothetical protein